MSDIVERLRDCGIADNETYRTCLEAAAEIERLRDEGQKDYDGMREFQRKFIHADHEIQRLREELLTRHAEARKQAAEIERLRVLLSEALDSEISDYWYVRVREALGHE